jgi:hypothetical protein
MIEIEEQVCVRHLAKVQLARLKAGEGIVKKGL